MANTLTNFLVGIGFDFDQRGAKEVDSAIDGIKTRALQTGAVIAGAFGINQLTFGFANATDTLGKFSDTFGVLPDDVAAFGRALAIEGGSLESFMQQLAGIERLRAGILAGNAEFIGLAGRAGIDATEITDAANATEAYIALADQFSRLSQQQRINAAQALGLDEASIRLLSRGSDEVEKLVERQRQLRPVTRDMIEESADFNRNIKDLTTSIGGFADTISVKLLPGINDTIEATTGWLNVNQDLINQKLDVALEPIANNIGAISAAGGLLATGGLLSVFAGMARFVPIVGSGLATVAAGLARLTGYGALLTTTYAIVQEAEQGGSLSATNLFGENSVTKFLDTPISELLPDFTFAPARLPGNGIPSAVSGIPSAVSGIPSAVSGIPGGSSQPQNINVTLTLDGQVLEQKIITVNDRQNEQAIRDIETSTGG